VVFIAGALFEEKEQKALSLHETIAEEIEKNKEQQLLMLQQNRLAQMGEMISMIAHQWRQPLNLLSLVNQTIIYKYETNKLDDTVIRNFKEKSSTVIQQMSSTIDDFRNFFKPEKEKTLFCINDVIDHVYDITEPIYRQKNIIMKHETEELYYTFGYPNELGQCILNIVNNAQDALVDCDKKEKRIIITLKKEKREIILSIIDNAGGIPSNIMHKVFDPYFSTKVEKNGTGLGLYISKIIIDEHMQGKLTVSNTQYGACFQIKLKHEKQKIDVT
jgi:signal transduction histidine kinase